MDIICFHGSCPDGFASAYVAHLRYPEAELMPLDHGAALDLEQFRDKDVLMLDFSLRTRELNDKLNSLAKSFRILDHHKTAQAVLAGAEYAVFDMNRSGAGLTWDYLFGIDSDKAFMATESATWTTGKFYTPRPWWVDYVEDRDLWLFKLPNSVAINDFIMTFEYIIEAWDIMTKSNVHTAATAGECIRLQVDKYVREAAKLAQPGTINVTDKHYSALVVNIPYLNCSEVGNVLAKRVDIGLSWFERADGILQFSLRSEGDIDVSEIAKIFGGGGHQHAAGFQLPLDKGRALVDTILGR